MLLTRNSNHVAGRSPLGILGGRVWVGHAIPAYRINVIPSYNKAYQALSSLDILSQTCIMGTIGKAQRSLHR
jgi:hypothetical protein